MIESNYIEEIKKNNSFFLTNLAETCFNDDAKFNRWNNFFKNADEKKLKELSIEEKVSRDVLYVLVLQAQENRLNIFLQNILILS